MGSVPIAQGVFRAGCRPSASSKLMTSCILALFEDIFVREFWWIILLRTIHNWRESSKVTSPRGIFSWPSEPRNHFTNSCWKLTNWIIENWWYFAFFTFCTVNQFTLQLGFDSIGNSGIRRKEILNTAISWKVQYLKHLIFTKFPNEFAGS